MDWASPKHSRRAFLAQSAATLAFARTSVAAPSASFAELRPIHLGGITAGGDLAHRTAQTFSRLQADVYRAPLVFRQTNWEAWPGDFEGRALLAITLLSRSTGHQPEYFPSMVAAYPVQLNAHGYFGPTLDLHAINEQQLSGHGWYLRGLCELYEYQLARPTAIPTQTAARTLAQIQTIVRNLALPLRGKYAVYPIDPDVRTRAAAPTNPGAVDGHLSGQHGDWAVSSDTGCAFIFLDGLAHAWVVLRAANDPSTPALKALIDEAIARFLEVDLVGIKAQTHASLTALRALLRVYDQTAEQNPDPKLLQAVQDRYHLYRTTAMTEHYANTNWFGRPDSWTEPCAIIDSFLVATQLWQHTGNAAYLEDAHLIWFNGVGRGLRSNGGFGTDTCPGFTSPFVKVRSYEAYFCCTMRGGEGHARAAESLYFTRALSAGVTELTVPFFSDSEAHLVLGPPSAPAHVFLRQTTAYPHPGATRIEVTGAGSVSALAEASQPAVLLRLFAPSWTTGHRLTVNGRPVRTTLSDGFLTASLNLKMGDVIVLEQDLRVGPRDPIHSSNMPGYYAFQAGPLLLGHKPAVDPAAPAPTLRSPDPAEVHIFHTATLTATSTPGTYAVSGTDIKLSPINDLNDISATPRDPCPRQVLFREA